MNQGWCIDVNLMLWCQCRIAPYIQLAFKIPKSSFFSRSSTLQPLVKKNGWDVQVIFTERFGKSGSANAFKPKKTHLSFLKVRTNRTYYIVWETGAFSSWTGNPPAREGYWCRYRFPKFPTQSATWPGIARITTVVLPSSRIDVHPNLCCWDQNQENFARVNVGTTVFFDFFSREY